LAAFQGRGQSPGLLRSARCSDFGGPELGPERVKEGSAVVEGTARVVTGSELDDIRQKVKAKYGFMTKLTKFLAKIGGIVKRNRIPYGDRGVIVTLTS